MRTELRGVAAQYAEAVLDLATASGGDAEEAVLRDLHLINQIVATDKELETVLAHPSFSAEAKMDILRALFGGKIQELTVRLLELLSEKRRLEILQVLEEEYKAKLNYKKNIVAASLVSSEPLSDEAIANIKARLTEHLGKRLELDVKVDQSLIGGVVLRLGDQVIDGSLKGKLKAIEKALLAV